MSSGRGIEIGDGRPVCVRQYQQPRRATEGDQDPVRCAIECHREICMMALGRKRPDCLPFREIDDLDQPGIGHIDKSPCATWFDHAVVFVPQPFSDEHGLLNADASPGELYVPWRTTATLLGGTQYLGSLALPGGSVNHVFSREGQTVMVLWSDAPG